MIELQSKTEESEKMNMPFEPNYGKRICIDTAYGCFSRYPIKTHVIMKDDVLEDIIDKYVKDYLQKGDVIFISEKIVAITQGRAFKVDEIKISPLANFLVKFVYKSSYGIGIGAPCTMELCIREVGAPKVLFAAICSAVGKVFGKRGVFYNICGMKARAIDGPCDCTIPPYNNYAKMAPDKPDEVAKRLMEHTGCGVVIIDANDIGVNVLGKSGNDISDDFCCKVFADNPLDQCSQQTPICIVRKAAEIENNEVI